MSFVKIEKACSIFFYLMNHSHLFSKQCNVFTTVISSLYFRFWLLNFISNCEYWIMI